MIAGMARHVQPELGLLLACARRRCGPQTRAWVDELLSAGVDWNRLMRTAAEHGLAPLLHHHLKSRRSGLVPGPVRERLRAGYLANAVHTGRQSAVLLDVLARLEGHGIRAVPHKGPVLAHSLYGSLALRPLADLDIVVARRDIPAARDILHTEGFLLTDDMYRKELTSREERYYLRNKAHLNFFRAMERGTEEKPGPHDAAASRGRLARPPGRTAVTVFLELHWAFMPAHWSFRLRPESLGHMDTVVLEERSVPAFRSEDLLVILCAHGSKHFWQRILWIADVAELIRQREDLDWDHVLDLSGRVGARRMVQLGIVAAAELLDAPVPPAVLEGARGDRAVVSLIADVREGLFHRVQEGSSQVPDENAFYFKLRERWRDRLPFFWHYLWRPNEKDRELLPLPNGLSFVHVILRPIRIAAHLVRNPSRLARLLGLRRR